MQSLIKKKTTVVMSQFHAFKYLLPAFLVYFLIIVIPVFYTLYLSFFEWNGVSTDRLFVGLSNYILLFISDSVFMTAFKNTFIWTACSVVFITVIALALALLLNRSFKGRFFYRGVFYFPFILSNIVVALMWTWLYHPTLGFFNSVLRGIGLESVGWLSDPKIALYSVFIAATWQQVGGSMVIFLAGLQAIPNDPYESAKVDGASSLQAFWHVTLPLLRETFIIVVATVIFHAMRVFDIVYAMTGGGPSQSTQVLASWMYYHSFYYNNVGIGSAISMILVVMITLIVIPYIWFMTRKSHL